MTILIVQQIDIDITSNSNRGQDEENQWARYWKPQGIRNGNTKETSGEVWWPEIQRRKKEIFWSSEERRAHLSLLNHGMWENRLHLRESGHFSVWQDEETKEEVKDIEKTIRAICCTRHAENLGRAGRDRTLVILWMYRVVWLMVLGDGRWMIDGGLGNVSFWWCLAVAVFNASCTLQYPVQLSNSSNI